MAKTWSFWDEMKIAIQAKIRRKWLSGFERFDLIMENQKERSNDPEEDNITEEQTLHNNYIITEYMYRNRQF